MCVPQNKTDSGFTLVELLMVIAIMGIMSLVVLGNQGSFAANLALRGATDQVILAFREAHVKAFAVYEGPGNRFDIGYGVHVADGDKMFLFADRSDSGTVGFYEDGEKVRDVVFRDGVSIEAVSACDIGASLEGVSAVFKRPRPVAVINVDGPGASTHLDCESLEIVLQHARSGERISVIFYPNADINVERP